ncbi:hypothetical protein Gogos_019390, partial [Gossypium gossypioides]|nr:hypothetical protein [Gossypium gossypioides]
MVASLIRFDDKNIFAAQLVMFKGGRILINWLKGNFDELFEDSKDQTEEVIQQYARAYITSLYNNFYYYTFRITYRFYRWDHGPSYVELPEVLEDIRFLLDQRSEFEFGWRKRISPSPQELKDLHKVDMRGKDNINWSVRHEEHIEAWDRRMQSIPVREQFFLADTAAVDNYLTWFRVVDKSYLLSPEERSRQIQTKRYIFRSLNILRILHPYKNVNVEPRVRTVSNVPTATDTSAHAAVDGDVDARYLFSIQSPKGVALATYSGDDDEEEEIYRPTPLDVPPV